MLQSSKGINLILLLFLAYSLDPIWTLKTGSLFLLTVESKALFLTEGLTLIVKDWDLVGKNETLGVVSVPATKLYEAKGERMEFKLQSPPGSNEEEIPGFLAIRARRATDYDKKFMEGYEASSKAVAAPDHPKTFNSDIKSILTRQYKVENGVKKVRRENVLESILLDVVSVI